MLSAPPASANVSRTRGMLFELIDMVMERGMHVWATAIAAKDVIIPSFQGHRGKRSFLVFLMTLLIGIIIRWLCDRLLLLRSSEGRRRNAQAMLNATDAHATPPTNPAKVPAIEGDRSPSPWVEVGGSSTPQKQVASKTLFWNGEATPQQSSHNLNTDTYFTDPPSPQAYPMMASLGGSTHNISDGGYGETSGARSSRSSQPSTPALQRALSPSSEEEEMLAASVSYNPEYRDLMMLLQKPDPQDCAKAFLGFSVVDDVDHHELVVDGIYRDGPAYQVGVRIADALTHIGGHRVNSVTRARQYVALHCRPAELAALTFLRPSGDSYTVKLWVMTAEQRFQGKPYYFDVSAHVKDQSPTASFSRRKSMGRH
ncbi:membrane-associated protein, putative [Bodo saltans]|uniref:Membrane-associated protein, putative n=1 Tax=Bodo saltans TaxID=75058 RepID=A0A0S4J689_BODSA|nr:membrane-associated protein, putative [Bodo saltans]|eukprot:CUG84610.1 membrane-associated protein, putative [Bodo saltans]